MVNLMRAGSETSGLLPTHARWWMLVCEDLVNSAPLKEVEATLIQANTNAKELRHSHFDATVKVMLNIQGQGDYRMSKKQRPNKHYLKFRQCTNSDVSEATPERCG